MKIGNVWPREGMFVLDGLRALEKVTVGKGEWIGVYEGIGGPLLAAGKSPRALARRLRSANASSRVVIHRAPSKKELPHKLEANAPDYWVQLKQGAFRSIAEARSRISNEIGFYAPEQVQDAKDFLGTLSNEARNSGKPRGDKARASENQ